MVGRVLVLSRDVGSGFAVAPRVVMTAHHVVRGAEGPITFAITRDRVVRVERVEPDDILDVALLYVDTDLPAAMPISQAIEGASWRVEARPNENDPLLTGTVDACRRSLVDERGHEVSFIQLRVDQQLGDYHGYSGSPVTLQSPRGAVVGVLVEQLPWRAAGLSSEPRPAANVLYAIPIQDAFVRLGIAASAAARPARFRVPHPRRDTIDRAELDDLINRVLFSLSSSGRVVLIRGVGGTGKTVLAQQFCHDARIWQAFPGGVLWITAGQDVQPDAFLALLVSTVGIDAAATSLDQPTLLLLDDVWTDELLRDVRGELADSVTLVATTRGIHLDGSDVFLLDRMTPSEAITLLGRQSPCTPSLREGLADLARVLGYWPLLLDMAARHLHLIDVDLPLDDDEPLNEWNRLDCNELSTRAEQIKAEFAADPTFLDDPTTQQRSLTRMVERSLTLLGDEQPLFGAMAAYPPDAELSETLLGDLWALRPAPTQRRMVQLSRVGLATITRRHPFSLRLHDIIVTWLHHRYGAANDPVHQDLHRRCVQPAMNAAGSPASLTADRADWLVFHLCCTGSIEDPARLLQPEWRHAYRNASGSEAAYLDALRMIVRHYGSLGAGSDVTLEAWMIQGTLLHASIIPRLSGFPRAALVALALLGHARAAIRQAANLSISSDAADILVRITSALGQHGRLSPAVARLAIELSGELFTATARCFAMTGIAETLLGQDSSKAVGLLHTARLWSESISNDDERSLVLARIAEALAPFSPSEALEILDEVQRISASSRNIEILPTLVSVIRALFSTDPQHVQQVIDALLGKPVDQCPTESSWVQRVAGVATLVEGRHVLAEVAETLACRDPTRALELIDNALAVADTDIRHEDLKRDQTGHSLVKLVNVLASIDPDRAQQVAEAIPDDGYRCWALAEVAQTLVLRQPTRAIRLVDEALRLFRCVSDTEDSKDLELFLVPVVRAIASVDSDRAQQVVEAQAARYEHSHSLSDGLANIAEVVASRDRTRASELLQRVQQMAEEASPVARPDSALAALAPALALIDPDIARQIAAVIPDNFWEDKVNRSSALAGIARTVAPSDLALAEQLIEEIPIIFYKSIALADIARILAPQDRTKALALANRALRIAADIAATRSERDEGRALVRVARAFASVDSTRARWVSEAIREPADRCNALAEVAKTLVTSDPTTGLKLLHEAYLDVYAIRDPEDHFDIASRDARSVSLANLAEAWASYDPSKARALLHEAERWWGTWSGPPARVVEVLAPIDMDAAEQLAETIRDEAQRSRALIHVAGALVSRKPNRARRLLEAIPSPFKQAQLQGLRLGRTRDRRELTEALSQHWFDVNRCLWLVKGFIQTRARASPDIDSYPLAQGIVDSVARFWGDAPRLYLDVGA